MLALDGESGAEIFSAATTREQARIVFDTAQMMAKRSPKFLEKYGVVVASHDIHLVSVFRSLASEADSLEGKNPHFCVMDEIQAQKTRTLYEVMETAMAKRDNNLLLSIGTAGSDRLGIGYEVRGRAYLEVRIGEQERRLAVRSLERSRRHPLRPITEVGNSTAAFPPVNGAANLMHRTK
jgi:phage terminase large subunit-like protein